MPTDSTSIAPLGIVYPSPVFGPIKSRRLGVSLGINLMPADGKICTFDCIYCECGFNAAHRPRLPRPTREETARALEERLLAMKENGETPDVLTFAGNGEPTAHPDFPAIIEDTIALRDRYFPKAKISVLSNATMTVRPEVRAALLKIDHNIQKLDTVSPEYITFVDRPTGIYDLEAVIESLTAFEGHVTIQSLFMKGTWEGRSVDNTSDDYVLPWIDTLRRIRPARVMVYTIDRATPAPLLEKASREELDRIASLVRAAGMETEIAY